MQESHIPHPPMAQNTVRLEATLSFDPGQAYSLVIANNFKSNESGLQSKGRFRDMGKTDAVLNHTTRATYEGGTWASPFIWN